MTSQPQTAFSPATRTWFESRFAQPTTAQRDAWAAIAAGDNALVVAPTGSGKTLSAFLWSLDRLLSSEKPTDPRRRCKVVYISPLKALAYDVDRNLRQPLDGITRAAARQGEQAREVTVAMRTGDTTPAQRRAFARYGSDILITTPESLYLLLTSAARDALHGVDTVIVDEVHAMTGTKRGAHLALSLERLDATLPTPAQRVGLSATVRPLAETARFLGGDREVSVVNPPAAKTIDLAVEITTPDLTNITDVDDNGQPSIWPSLIRRLYDLIAAHRSTIVFANSRLLTERVCARLNEMATQLPATERAEPASMMAQSQASSGAPRVLARAHHGSMAREERLQVEDALKSGELSAVIATSSLELGIDMGAVDLVAQIGSPPSVAAGTQRVGRAGHHVGAISRGVVLPTHRADLLAASVTTDRVLAGELEELRVPRNPVDVLAQHIVAMVAMDDWHVPELAGLIKRAAPFQELSDQALWAVLDMLAGKYPSTSFAGLKPKLVWDRPNGRLSARPNAQNLAVLNAGTIPDRGLYGVFVSEGGAGARVGELEEEMVYESRVGDVFLLGATSWRIDAITPDRVLVSPAAGRAARLPFWKGEDPGRPAQLGNAMGARVRELDPGCITDSALNEAAADNLSSYIAEQREQAGAVCDDRTVVLERFRDELGDWRVVVHCLLGAKVNRPWALAIAARLRQQHGIDGHIMAADDGIVIRVPDTVRPPGAELLEFDGGEITSLVAAELENSPLFAARFRECAARALLLPRRGVGRRQPLWQQRQRAGQLFEVAHDFADFPITAEAARECLEDYFDLPALETLMRRLTASTVSIVEVTTARPSPFAQNLLMSYTAGNLYGEDEPLAERRAAAINSGMLRELLGEEQQPLDPNVVAEAETWLRWRDGRQLSGAEDTAELLRVLGDAGDDELAARGLDPDTARQLERAGRAINVTIAGEPRWVAVEDAARYRDGAGVNLPDTVDSAFLAPVPHALDDLLARYARTHGPFTTQRAAEHFGIGVDTTEAALHRLDADGIVRHGDFDSAGTGWCAVEVLRILHRKTLRALRAEITPVEQERYVSFLADWQLVGDNPGGIEHVADVMEQLQGAAIPASAWESLVLPARVADYETSHLEELTAGGELLWAGAGALSNDGWVVFSYAESAPLLLPPADENAIGGDRHRRVLEALETPRFFRELPFPDDDAEGTVSAIWDLVWGGWISNDSMAALRALVRGAGQASRSRPPERRRRASRLRTARTSAARASPPTAAGRWYRLPERDTDPTRRAHAATASLLDRHGIVVRGTAAGHASGFAGQYPVLSAVEDSGAVRRGYFVSGLGAAQFAEPGAVDRLRAMKAQGTVVLAACDPANPYGAGLPWPPRGDDGGGHRAGRKAGALVVIIDGRLCWYLERGGRTLLTYTAQPRQRDLAAEALATTLRGTASRVTVTQVDGRDIGDSPEAAALTAAGFRLTPKGLRLD